MKNKHISVILSIAALSGLSMLGCDEDSKEPACKTEGYVSCNGTCIDPMASNQFCGANTYCEGYVACKDTETCFNGRCRPTSCEPDEHYYDVVCEKDSEEHCGEHGAKCAEKVEGWKSGTCVDKTCIPDTCTTGLHPFENKCVSDDINHCGSHDTDCAVEVSGWADGTCEGGKCHVSACQDGLHPYSDACEADDVDNCGAHGSSCSLTVNGWADGNCVQATCTVKTCAEGMHVYENACELDDVENCGLHGRACATTVAGWQSGACAQGTCKLLQCIDGFHVNADTGECAQDTKACCGASCTKCAEGLVCAGGECRAQCKDTEAYCNGECTNIETSTENCGECGHDCNAEKPQNAKSMSCQNSTCNIVDCNPGYHIEIQDDKRVCKADTVNACGAQATNCTKNTWWEDGTCKAGKCIPSACKGDYHLAQDNSGENFCEADDAQNCGEHGHVCAGGQQCAGGRCLGNTICDDVLCNTLTDLDHCGDCNHRCDDGLICDKGQCKKGNGQAYCSGNKVTMGTINRCSSCSDKCSDSLICKDNACMTGAGMTYCSGITFNTLTDIDHCGSCNHKCANGLICSEGSCKAGNGVMYCSGVKVDSTNDSAHCSGCGNLCPAGSICGKTSNIVACNEGVGSTYCSGIQRNTSNDSANCGQCGRTATHKICKDGEFIDPSVGGTVSFGNYNGTPIQWHILDHDAVNHRIMLLSMNEWSRQYHTKQEAVTWAESTIRSWLNGYGANENKQSVDYTSNNFIKSAFTNEERAKIAKLTVVNENNPQYGTPGGVNTQDQVFLLSIAEVKNLLGTKDDMCTKIHCTTFWWLRSPGFDANHAANVNYFDGLHTFGYNVDSNIGVRPALWLNY